MEMETSVLGLSSTLIIALAITVIFLLKAKSSSAIKWPPGPKTLPIIGNLHQLGGDELHIVLAKLARVHGAIMTIWMAKKPVIVVSDVNSVWEVLVSKSSDYAARDAAEISKIVSASSHSINTSDSGPYWQTLRRGLTHGPLGPLNISAQIPIQQRDMQRVIREMQQDAAANGGVIKPLDHLKRSSTRLVSRLIFGDTFDNDPYNDSMHEVVQDLNRFGGIALLEQAFSFAKYLPSYKRGVKEFHIHKRKIDDLVRPVVASSNPPSNSYLGFLQSQNYSEEIIIACIFELYLLAMDSSASTATWALAFMIRDQQVQEKLYQDIKRVIGDEVGLVKAEDLSKMHYLQAVVKETMRMKPIAPLAIPHKTAIDTSLMGTKVPKGTCVMVNLYALHHDESVWAKPYTFMPERFLQREDGKSVTEQAFLPFGAGMRICGGMEVGKLQFSLALANLVNAFKWTSAAEGKLPDMSDELQFITVMKTPLEARIVPRNP
uniref:Pluviatolide synthase n=1 Tax=Podophyllum peltatum TaxID=35933 RepID=C719A_PODPE|nr:RecName: Full=Pluviatolide synthase; AltName: Full=Cytochrome P450 family 719 subfamily A polypeptide 23 [Podophyllum peltatum]ANY58172.1 CYP719A24 [synthetic construct]